MRNTHLTQPGTVHNTSVKWIGLCNLVVVKTICSIAWRCALAMLMAGGVLSLHAQTNDTSTNAPTAAPTNAAPVEMSGTNSASNDAIAVEPAPEPTPAPEAVPQRAPASSSGKLDYSSFRMVNDRNIFNGNRSGAVITSTRSSSVSRSVRIESFSLVGTLLSAKGPTAFFDGTDSSFRQVLKPGERIAGFQIQEILHSGVRLAEGTNTLDLAVGTSLRREDEGLWKFSTSRASYASSSSGGFSSSAGSSYRSHSSDRGSRDRNGSSYSRSDNHSSPAATESAPDPNVDEVLKRLMEKRDKE